MKRRLMAFGNLALFFLLVVSLVGCGGAQSATFTTHTGGPAAGSGTGSTHSDAPASRYYDKSGITSGKDATGGELPEGALPADGSSGSAAAAPTSTTAAAGGAAP